MALNEKHHDSGFLLSEAEGSRARDNATLLLGQNLEAGTVLGKITASGKYVILDPAASDGSQAAAAILLNAIDATAADTACAIIIRDAEVNSNELVWGAGVSAGQKTAALAELKALGIIAR